MKKYSKNLSRLSLFYGIADDDISVILEKLGVYVKCYKKNEYIRYSGDKADFIGIVLDGNVHILQDDYYGNRNIIASFGKETIFAEAFACAGIERLPVDILAGDNSEVMFINRDKIFNTCGQCCEFHYTIISNLLKIVAKKNMILNQKIQYTMHKTTAEKIMAYLNGQARLHKSPEFNIPFNRQELADYLGVDRSAMSNEISKLVKQGIIETKRNHFKLLRHDESENEI